MKKTKRTKAPGTRLAKDGASMHFAQNYTRTEDGFYVRNSNPSSGTYDDKRLIANIRFLLHSAVASD
jgi:hypothetical protein